MDAQAGASFFFVISRLILTTYNDSDLPPNSMTISVSSTHHCMTNMYDYHSVDYEVLYVYLSLWIHTTYVYERYDSVISMWLIYILSSRCSPYQSCQKDAAKRCCTARKRHTNIALCQGCKHDAGDKVGSTPFVTACSIKCDSDCACRFEGSFSSKSAAGTPIQRLRKLRDRGAYH
jgi:hypothetical protein